MLACANGWQRSCLVHLVFDVRRGCVLGGAGLAADDKGLNAKRRGALAVLVAVLLQHIGQRRQGTTVDNELLVAPALLGE